MSYTTLAGTSAGIYRSNDNGVTWTQATILPTTVSVYEMYDPGGGRHLAGTNDGIYFSLTNDQSWTKLTTPVAEAYSFATYMIYGQVHLFCGTSDGVWTSAYPSYGASWGQLNNAAIDGKAVRRLVYNGTNLIAAVWDGATGLGIYKSPRSTAWVAANTGLGNLNVNGLAIGTPLYAATDDGLYESTDGAASWHEYGTGLPSRVIKAIATVWSTAGYIFCAPQGGGVYKKGVPPILTPVLVSPANNETGVTAPTTLTWSYPVGNPTAYDLQYSTTVNFATGTFTTISNLMGTSVVVPGLNPTRDYYWKVRASVDGSWTSYSTPSKFTMADFAAPPTVPTSITFSPTSPFTTQDITPTAGGSVDPNVGDTVSYEYEWCVSNNGGASYGAWGHPERTVLADETIRGQKWKCRATATDGVLSSAPYESPTIVTIANSAPSAPNALIFDPTAPTTDHDITPTASGALDLDGESVTYEYEWAVSFDGGVNFSGWIFNSPILRATATEADEQWKCRSRASDGSLPGAWYEDAPALVILAGATPPTAPTAIAFSTTTPTNTQDVTATASGSTGEAATYTYEWTVSTNNGVTWSAYGHAGPTLSASLTTSGQKWRCRTRADGASGSSPWFYSPTIIVIDNLAPSVPTAAAINEPTPDTTVNLTAGASGSLDPEGLSVTYEFEWRSDDGTGWSVWGNPGDTILAASTARGQQWQVRARATDGAAASDWFELTTPVTIINSAPTIATAPVITPAAPSIGENLTIAAAGGEDVDGDPLTYSGEWWLSTDGGANFIKSDAITTNNGLTLLGAATDAGQQWKAKIQASDGSLQSAWAESAPITMGGNHAPTAPTTVAITPAGPTDDQILTASALGSTDADGTSPGYVFEWSKMDPGGSTWSDWGNPGETIDAALTISGEKWKVRAQATDGIVSSAWVESVPVNIDNVGPTAPTNVTVTPLNPGPEELTATAEGATDPNGDDLAYRYEWYKQNLDGTWGPVLYTGATLPASYVKLWSVWRVRAQAFDGAVYGPYKYRTTSKILTTALYSPVAGTRDVPTDTVVYVDFRRTPVQDSVTSRVELRNGTTVVPVTMTWDTDKRLKLTPDAGLKPAKWYRIYISPGVECADGHVLNWAESHSYFVTAATVAPAGITLAAAPTAAGAQVTVNLSSAATVRTVICNIAGRVVAELPERDLPAGVSSLLWSGKSNGGTKVPAGMYLVRVQAKSANGEQATALAPLQIR